MNKKTGKPIMKQRLDKTVGAMKRNSARILATILAGVMLLGFAGTILTALIAG